MVAKPSTYLSWIPSGSSSYIQTPSAGQSTTGWVVNEAPPFQYMNFLFYYTDQWIQYFDSFNQSFTASQSQAISDYWVMTGTTTSGSDQLTALQITQTTTGNTTNLSAQITSLASTTGIQVGMLITGTGIPTGTFVQSISGTTVVASKNATATNTGTSLTFAADIPVGSLISSSLSGVTAGTYVKSVSSNTVTMSQNSTASHSGATITFSHAFATGLQVQWQLDELDGQLNYLSSLPQFYMLAGNSSSAATPVNTNLLGDVRGSVQSQTFTVTIASPGVITATSHGLANGDKVYFTTNGALPTGLSVNTTYYVVATATATFEVALVFGGTAINTTGSQSGTHTLYAGGIKFDSPIVGEKQFELGIFNSQTTNGRSFTISGINGLVVNYTISSGDTVTLTSAAYWANVGPLISSGTLVVTSGLVKII